MVEHFLKLEREQRGSLVGISCLSHLISVAEGNDHPADDGRRRALAILMEHYADHRDLDVLCYAVRRIPEAKPFLHQAAKSQHRHVRGIASLALAELLKEEAVQPEVYRGVLDLMTADPAGFEFDIQWYTKALKRFRDVDSAQSRSSSIESIEQVIANYGDIRQAPRLGHGPLLLKVERSEVDALTKRRRRPLSELADSLRFELEHLAIGCPAPEISGPDSFGHELTLSRHRGKVTVVMFSFKGCGPCEAMYPHNRKLVAEYVDRPFAFLGVMGDETIGTVKEAVEQGKITWPVWWDGRTGPVSRRWNVRGWPAVFVLDHKGVIRYRASDLQRGELLARAVAKLVAAAEK
jgi:peroxiredoxin